MESCLWHTKVCQPKPANNCIMLLWENGIEIIVLSDIYFININLQINQYVCKNYVIIISLPVFGENDKVLE